MYKEEIVSINQSFDHYKDRITNFSKNFEFGLFLYISRNNIVWLIISIIIAIVSSLIYLRYTVPLYEIKTTIQIDRGNTTSKVLENNDLFMPDDGIAHNLELLKSNFILLDAIKRLPLEVEYFKKGQFLTMRLYRNNVFDVKVLSQDPDILNVPITLNLLDGDYYTLSYRIGDRDTTTTPFHINSTIKILNSILKIENINKEEIRRTTESVKSTAFYFKIPKAETLIYELKPGINISLLNSGAQTITITVTNATALLAKELTDAIIQSYIEHDIDNRSKSYKKILDFLDSRLSTVDENLSLSEQLVQDFRNENDITNIQNFSSIYYDQFSELENQVVGLNIKLSLLKEIDKTLNTENTDVDVYQFLSSVMGYEMEASLESLIGSLKLLLVEKESALYKVTPNSEIIKSLDHQINIEKKLLLETIKSIAEKTISTLDEIKEKIHELSTRFNHIPSKEFELSKLLRTAEIHQKFYTMLLEKKTEVSIANEGFVNQVTVLDSPDVPKYPISPKKMQIIFFFLVGGITFGLLIIIIKYLLYDEITSLNEISKYTNASVGVLGIIPKYKKDIPVSQLIIDKNPKSLITESFRTIRTNLQFISNTSGPKVMAITSTISGEGKTFASINLAGIIAFSGKKVIIMDLDMRKPKIHIGFGVENIKGMSTLLIEKDTLDNCIHNSSLANLDFITAGPIPPNPSELIINGKIDILINQLKKRYDVVIIDNPPVGLVTDGISLIQKSDYPIYIFRAEVSKRAFIQNVDRLINENHISKLSVILNGVDITKNNYGYNYGYGYGYGYGNKYGYTNYYDEGVSFKKKKSLFKRLFSFFK